MRPCPEDAADSRSVQLKLNATRVGRDRAGHPRSGLGAEPTLPTRGAGPRCQGKYGPGKQFREHHHAHQRHGQALVFCYA